METIKRLNELAGKLRTKDATAVEEAKILPSVLACPELCCDRCVMERFLDCCVALSQFQSAKPNALELRAKQWALRTISKCVRPCFSHNRALESLVCELGLSRETILRDCSLFSRKQRDESSIVELMKVAIASSRSAQSEDPRTVDALARLCVSSRANWCRFLRVARCCQR